MKIIYKIINSALVLALIPVLLFLPMFRFIMVIGMSSSNQLLSMLGSMFDINSIITKATGFDFSSLPEFYTIKSAYELFTGEGSFIAKSGLDASAFPEDVIKFFSAAGILLCVALVIAVVVLLVGLFTKQYKLCAGFSALSFACAFAGGKCFSHIAQQLVSGKISLVPVISQMEALKDYASYMNMVNIDIRLFDLASAFTMMLVILGALIALNIGFSLVKSISD